MIAEAHEPYVHGADRIDEAVDRLAGIKPFTVTSDRPLLRITERDPTGRLEIVPFQHPDTGRYMNVLGDTRIEVAPELITALRLKVAANRRHFPREETLADAFGVPGLYVRLDCFITAAGTDSANPQSQAEDQAGEWGKVAVAICEFDDQPAFVGSFMKAGHQAAYQWFARLAAELDALGRPLRLAEFGLDSSFNTLGNYPHDDRHWLDDVGRNARPTDIAAVVRARRFAPGSQRFLERWTPASIFPGSRFRDYKGVLGVPKTVDAELGLGVLVHDHAVARAVIAQAHRQGLGAVMAKGLFSARKEAALAILARSRVPSSYYRLNQLKRLEHGRENGGSYVQSLVLQPAFTPPTFEDLGIRLTEGDTEATAHHKYRTRAGGVETGEKIFAHLPGPGNERHFHGLFRLYFVYLPSENRGEEKYARFAGGLLQGCTTPMAIHGSNGALTVWVQAMRPGS
jgi:hypothetical protein